MTAYVDRVGHHFLLTPGPTNLPQPVIAAMNRNSADISAPDFAVISRQLIDDMKSLFRTRGEVFAYIANGHGAWEAALINTLQPGDRVLVPTNGHFAGHWAKMAESLGLRVTRLEGDWRRKVDIEQFDAALAADPQRSIKAVLAVDIDTATGVRNDIAAIRTTLDRNDHPAWLLVDAVASLGCVDVDCDAWRADVVVAASQKGLMGPPGMSFAAVRPGLINELGSASGSPRCYWDWRHRQKDEWYHWFCGTAPTHLIFAMRAAVDLLLTEGLTSAAVRHERLARATRTAVAHWSNGHDIELFPKYEEEAANSVTTIQLAEPHDARAIKAHCYERYNVSLGGGLSHLDGRAFRIGHMGAVNEATLLGAIGCVESALLCHQIPIANSGVAAAAAALANEI